MNIYGKSLSLVAAVLIVAGVAWYTYCKFVRVAPEEVFIDKPKAIVGISIKDSLNAPMQERSDHIGKLWKKFHDEKLAEKIPNAIANTMPYGVYHDYNSSAGEETVTVGMEVSSVEPKEEQYTYITVPVGKYLRFSKKDEQKGVHPELVVQLWQDIDKYFADSTKYIRDYKVDFEEYSAQGVDIYISYSVSE